MQKNGLDIQKKEFRRLGVEGDWSNPYLTMSNEAEAQIVRELGKFLIDESFTKVQNLFYGLLLKKNSISRC